jgi:hypothetical protein
MSTIRDLRDYEAKTLRPKWDALSSNASREAGVLNWENADADDWDREGAVAYTSMVMRWAIQIPPKLEAADPTGTSSDPDYVSLRRTWNFHVAKIVHLQKLGISNPRVPSDLEAIWSGIQEGIISAPENLLSLLGYVALAALGVLFVVGISKSK